MLVTEVEKVGNLNIFYVENNKHLLFGISKVLDYVEKGLKVLYINTVDDRKDIVDVLLKYTSTYKDNIKLKTLGYLIFDGSLKICRDINVLVNMDKCELIDFDVIIIDSRRVKYDFSNVLKLLSDYTNVFVIK